MRQINYWLTPISRSGRARATIIFVGLCLSILAVAARIYISLKLSNSWFGLNYGLFHPDGTIYSQRMLQLRGENQLDAFHKSQSWLDQFESVYKDRQEVSAGSAISELDAILKFRFMYPLFAAVAFPIFGMWSPLAVSILAFFSFIALILYSSFKEKVEICGLGFIIFLTSSSTFMRWAITNCTDMLALAFLAWGIWLYSQKVFSNRIQLWIGTLFLSLACLTRPVGLLVVALVVALTLQGKNRSKFRANSFWITRIVLLLVACVSTFGAGANVVVAVNPSTPGSALHKILSLPLQAIKYFGFEIMELAAIDRITLIGLSAFTALIFVLRHESNVRPHLVVAVATLLLSLVNSTPGVNCRYWMPFALIAWLLILEKAKINEEKVSSYSR